MAWPAIGEVAAFQLARAHRKYEAAAKRARGHADVVEAHGPNRALEPMGWQRWPWPKPRSASVRARSATATRGGRARAARVSRRRARLRIRDARRARVLAGERAAWRRLRQPVQRAVSAWAEHAGADARATRSCCATEPRRDRARRPGRAADQARAKPARNPARSTRDRCARLAAARPSERSACSSSGRALTARTARSWDTVQTERPAARGALGAEGPTPRSARSRRGADRQRPGSKCEVATVVAGRDAAAGNRALNGREMRESRGRARHDALAARRDRSGCDLCHLRSASAGVEAPENRRR